MLINNIIWRVLATIFPLMNFRYNISCCCDVELPIGICAYYYVCICSVIASAMIAGRVKIVGGTSGARSVSAATTGTR